MHILIPYYCIEELIKGREIHGSSRSSHEYVARLRVIAPATGRTGLKNTLEDTHGPQTENVKSGLEEIWRPSQIDSGLTTLSGRTGLQHGDIRSPSVLI